MLDTKYGMKYPFPHTLVHIVDNSAYTGELPVAVADNPSMYGTLVVSGFPMGEDGKVISITRSDILNVAYGLGNIGPSEIKKYGQTITYPLSLIDQGAPVQLLRVTPPDATYAYSCITIEWMWNPETCVLHVRYGEERLPNDRDLVNYQNKDRLAAAIKKAVKTDDHNGWKRRAFMINIGAGRGSAYNSYTTAINQTVQSKRPANAQYLFTTIDTKTNQTVEQFLASLVNINNSRVDSIDPVNIVIGKRAAGSSIVVPYLNEEAIQELYEDYRMHFDAMLADSVNVTSDYEQDVAKALTINTFDPIFGLYLYGGTDQNAKLPYFQVDMRSADLPELPESQRVYYTDGQDPDMKVSEKLLSLTTGITRPTDKVHIGDMYLYAGATSYNNPYIYVVVGINQFSGAVTTVRTNTVHFVKSAAYINTNSRLASLIEVDTTDSFYKKLNERISKGYVKDGDTVAWFNTVNETWDLFYVTTGSQEKVAAGTYIAEVTADQANILPMYSANAAENPGYSIIAWDTMTNIGNLVGIVNAPYTVDGAAVNRAGATCVDLSKDFGVDSECIWVNSGYYTPGTEMEQYFVADRTLDAVKKYGAPPTTLTASEITPDVIGTQFDAFKCDEEHAQAYTIKSDATVTFDAPTGVTGSVLGWKPEGDQLFRFAVTETATEGTYTMKEISDSQVSKAYYDSDLFNKQATTFVALNIFSGYLSEYEQLASEPADWESSYTSYFTRNADGTFTAIPSGETAPEFVVGAYFKHNAGAQFFGTSALTTASKYDVTSTVNQWSAFKDVTTPSMPKYYKIATGAYTELTGITSDNQFLRWYHEAANGDWVIDTNAAETSVGLGGYNVSIPGSIFEYVMDARSAAEIHRYTVISTLGSLYRIQENAVSPSPDYYSDQYGINITSSDGGVALADGYTGFFDDVANDIEYKWKYSILMTRAFRGEIDPRIMSPTRTPAKYLFDGAWNTVVGQSSLPTMSYTAADLISASTVFTDDEKDEVLFDPDMVAGWQAKNTDVDVKQAMYDLMEYRIYQGIPEDKRPIGPGSGLSLHLDSGYTDATTATIINNSFMKRFDNPNASWDIGGWVSSADGIAYTYVKRIADNLFRHCATYSVNKPFVNTYTKIDRSEYISYFPDIDTTDWEYRELMYNSGGNAWIPDVNGAIMRRSQRTLMRGSDTSDLIQESNMRTLTQLVYLLQNKLDEKLFEYNDDSILRTMQDEVNNMFTNWVGNLVDGLDINFDRDINPDDGGELVVCYVNVVFRGINLRIPIIVNVNRRTTTT